MLLQIPALFSLLNLFHQTHYHHAPFRTTVLSWFKSYLGGRTQFVRCGACKSAPATLSCGVPQGSVLGPILFLLYTADLLRLIDQHNLSPHLYADDTQIYGYCSPSAALQLQEQVSTCIDDVAEWMKSNRLQLNTAKTEVLRCASSDVIISYRNPVC